MKSHDLVAAGWKDITGSFAERDRYLEMSSRGEAVVRRLRDGWFGKIILQGTKRVHISTMNETNERKN